MIRTFRAAKFIPVMLAGAFATLSQAAAIGTFNFDNDTAFTTTPFTDTNNGISATFTSPGDPGGFIIAPSTFQALSGNVLGSNSGTANQLDVTFNQPIVAATFTFATSDFGAPQPLDLEALSNGSPIGTTTAMGIVPAGFTFPEGEIAFEGPSFNQLIITTPDSRGFAIDNVVVVEAPEPGSASLIFLGLLAAFAPVVARRVSWRKMAASRLARTALAAASIAGVSSAADLLPLPATQTSTMPANGDVNPYGVAFVPKTVPTDGILKPGAILVSNFNNNENLQGTGTSIVQIDRNGVQTLFLNNLPPVTGMTAALGIFSDGLVLVGYEPSLDGTPNTVSAGGLEIINREVSVSVHEIRAV